MNTDTINIIHTSQQSTKEGLNENLKEIFDKAKQSIKANRSEQPNGTLAMTFHKYAGEATPYVRFGYSPYNISNTPGVNFTGSMNADPINGENRSTINDAKNDN